MDPTAPTQLLEQLRDIHLPPDPGWWPPAPGWWLLAGLALAAVGWLGWLGLRALRRYVLYRRVARELDALCARYRESGDTRRLAADVSRLLRRAALREEPRDRVAGLTGEAWLDYLDRRGGTRAFSRGPGRCLATAPYGAPGADVDERQLAALVRRWLRSTLGR